MAEDESKDGASLEALVERLKGSRRRGRQEAAHEIAVLAKADPQSLVTYADDLVDALDRPEAQTRWEMLDALTSVTSVDASVVAAGFDGAEASLFDDGSAIVRLAAFKFLSCYGATSERASDAVWPLLDEAVQCYHGDPEYHDMLVSMLEFARGSLSEKSIMVSIATSRMTSALSAKSDGRPATRSKRANTDPVSRPSRLNKVLTTRSMPNSQMADTP